MNRLADLAEALKLEHTIFALPFAYLGLWVASARGSSFASRGNPTWSAVLWVTLAMVAARTTGMALNRLIDLPMDRLNLRTIDWPVPAGRVKPISLGFFAAVSALLFFFSASRLTPICFTLAPVALALLVLYPYLKRFTWTCHFGLGAVLACAPVGGWLGVSGRWETPLFPLWMGVLFWVAGFDILYALLDLDFDRKQGVYSIPQRFGVTTALFVSRLSHTLAALSFGWFGLGLGMGRWFWVGWALTSGLLIYEHCLVGPTRLHRINQAFFTVNGWVSVSFFLFTLIDLKGF